MNAPATTERLAEIIRSVTDLWDEPLDEVHDVPQIVNALQAAGVGFVAQAQAEAWDEGYARDWTGGIRWHNPYREVPADCDCIACRRARIGGPDA